MKVSNAANNYTESMYNRRVLIFADWDNTFYSAKNFNRKLDWLKLRNYLANYREGRQLIEMVI